MDPILVYAMVPAIILGALTAIIIPVCILAWRKGEKRGRLE